MPDIKDMKKSPVNRLDDINQTDIEDILTAPLKKDVVKSLDELKDLGDNKNATAKEKLEKIFKNSDLSDIYETDSHGNLIIGYEEVIKDGKTIKKPIIQNKLDAFDENNLLNIEVELDPKYAKEKDDLGLNSLERKRYNKLIAMNKGNNYRTQEEIIRKAKNKNDLDSTIVPDMMMHFLTSEEDELNELSLSEKNEIKRLRRKGMIIEPRTVSGFHKSLKLAARDRTVHYSNFFKWITRKGYNIENLSTERLSGLQAEYKKEIRPSIELLIDAAISGTKERVLKHIKEEYKDDPDNGDMQIRILVNNPKNYINLINIMKEEEFDILSPSNFTEVETYFRVYGLHEEDSKQFSPNYVSDPRSNVTTQQKLEEFKTFTGNDFVDVYGYWWEIVSKDKEEMDKARQKSEEGIPEEAEETIDHTIAQNTTIVEDIDFEEDDLDLI